MRCQWWDGCLEIVSHCVECFSWYRPSVYQHMTAMVSLTDWCDMSCCVCDVMWPSTAPWPGQYCCTLTPPAAYSLVDTLTSAKAAAGLVNYSPQSYFNFTYQSSMQFIDKRWFIFYSTITYTREFIWQCWSHVWVCLLVSGGSERREVAVPALQTHAISLHHSSLLLPSIRASQASNNSVPEFPLHTN